jgi:hypothetical protein
VRAVAVVAVTAALAGCGAAATGSSGTAPATVASTPSRRPWLEYSRTGGIAGFDDRVTVTVDGAVTASTKGAGVRRYQLSPTENARLHRLAGAAGAAGPAARASTGPGRSDALVVRLSIDGRTVAVPDGQAPDGVTALLAELGRLAVRG